MEVRFFDPPADLAPCFGLVYRMDVNVPTGQVLEDYLQPEWCNLRFFAHGSARAFAANGQMVDAPFGVTGPSMRPTHFEIGRSRVWGIAFTPLGWARFIDAPAKNFTDSVFDGAGQECFRRLGEIGRIVRATDASDEAIVERIMAFFRELAPPPRGADRILAVYRAILDPYLVDVPEFADRVGVTIRTLERHCGQYFGFPPRLLLRRHRMMRTIAAFMLSGGANWTEVIDRHYHDQAHFVHEFQTFMGMSPTQYARMGHPILQAFMAERQRIWGSPALSDKQQPNNVLDTFARVPRDGDPGFS